MTPDEIFSICNALALLGWIVLIFLPFWKKHDQYVFGGIIVLLAIIYSWTIFSVVDKNTINSFNTLDGVSSLFKNKMALLAGWVHYLAFDLLTGIYIARNAANNGLNHWLITPTLLLTFLFGPLGLLLYSIIRVIKTRKFLTGF